MSKDRDDLTREPQERIAKYIDDMICDQTDSRDFRDKVIRAAMQHNGGNENPNEVRAAVETRLCALRQALKLDRMYNIYGVGAQPTTCPKGTHVWFPKVDGLSFCVKCSAKYPLEPVK